MWTQRQALLELKALEPLLKGIGFHCGLTGSVMYVGESFKDLDVIIYPRDVQAGTPPNWDIVKEFLKRHFECEESYQCQSSREHSRDAKNVWVVTTKTGQRIDFFFLS